MRVKMIIFFVSSFSSSNGETDLCTLRSYLVYGNEEWKWIFPFCFHSYISLNRNKFGDFNFLYLNALKNIILE